MFRALRLHRVLKRVDKQLAALTDDGGPVLGAIVDATSIRNLINDGLGRGRATMRLEALMASPSEKLDGVVVRLALDELRVLLIEEQRRRRRYAAGLAGLAVVVLLCWGIVRWTAPTDMTFANDGFYTGVVQWARVQDTIHLEFAWWTFRSDLEVGLGREYRDHCYGKDAEFRAVIRHERLLQLFVDCGRGWHRLERWIEVEPPPLNLAPGWGTADPDPWLDLQGVW